MKNIITSITSLLCASVLTGCGVYTNFKTPEYKSEEVASSEIEIPDTSAVTLPTWQEYFSDTHLQTIIAKGLENNVDLQTAMINIDKAEAMLLSSKLAYLPSFAFSPSATVGSTSSGASSFTYSLPVQASWEIDLAGRLRNTKEQARVALLQSEEYVRLVKTNLIAAIANSYYTLVLLDEQADITQRTIKNLKRNVEVMQSLKDVGMQTEAAVAQASANYNRVAISYEELLRDIQLAQNALCLILNEPPHAIERSGVEAIAQSEFLSTSISMQALSNRPDVKVAEYDLARNFYGVNLARSAFYPSITLGGSAGWTNNLGGAIVNPAEWLFSAVASLTQPIFNKGVNVANLKVAKASYEQSLLTFQQALLSAGNEVNDAIITYQTAQSKEAIRDAQISDLRRAVTTTEELMKYGSITYLEILLAENALLEAELMKVADWLECEQSKVSLYRALGAE